MSIYVEILIRAPLDAVWEHTQTPELHERWDLRFSEIDYLPRGSATEPQRTSRVVFASVRVDSASTKGRLVSTVR
jgi:uncharacterized protein YndB with AHSA1/START domain